MNSPLNCADSDVSETDAVCEAHGPYVAKTYTILPGSPGVTLGCPACASEARSASDARREAREREHARRVKEAKIQSLLWQAGIPPRFAEKTIDGYIPETHDAEIAKRAAMKYADNFRAHLESGMSLIFAGAPGTGKTHLAVAIGSAVIQKFQAVVLFGTASAILRSIKETYRKEATRTETEVIATVVAADLLILDEIGVQIGSEHEKQLMFEVLNERYQQMRPTILISNLTPEELEVFLGQRVMDRHRECGYVIGFGWESYRGKRQADRKTQAAGGE